MASPTIALCLRARNAQEAGPGEVMVVATGCLRGAMEWMARRRFRPASSQCGSRYPSTLETDAVGQNVPCLVTLEDAGSGQ